ncbi:hypothetical protein C1645_755827 [Glomus cerebriforme]|uniref:HMG box domain-containing protein n=1 Tax=Glomus cerebriforme TaxID=658196 RepID=A0A397TD23_9GLOM|nr:hypothetical protein C1645_755827 [Glomus cerebriforme]
MYKFPEITKFVGKPPNAFILYRSYHLNSDEYKSRTPNNRRAADISSELGERWHNEDDNVKKIFYARGRIVDKLYAENSHENNVISDETSQCSTGSMNVNSPICNNTQDTQENLNMIKLSDQQYLLRNPSTGQYFIHNLSPTCNTDEPGRFELEYPTSELAGNHQPTYDGFESTPQANVLSTYDNFGFVNTFPMYDNFGLANTFPTYDNPRLANTLPTYTYDNFELTNTPIYESAYASQTLGLASLSYENFETVIFDGTPQPTYGTFELTDNLTIVPSVISQHSNSIKEVNSDS